MGGGLPSDSNASAAERFVGKTLRQKVTVRVAEHNSITDAVAARLMQMAVNPDADAGMRFNEFVVSRAEGVGEFGARPAG